MTNGNTEPSSSQESQRNTDKNTQSEQSNENPSDENTQNVEKATKYPVITDKTPQEPKNHPGRIDNQIPKAQNQNNRGQGSPGVTGGSSVDEKSPVGEHFPEGTPVIEKPLQQKVHKIAPETRLPGEFTSPESQEHNLLLKTKTNTIKRPFSTLLDARQRDEIRHLGQNIH